MRPLYTWALLLGFAGCLNPFEFTCQDDAQCHYEGAAGTCIANGLCAYPADDCESALRYGPAAGDRAHECVGDDTTATTGTTDTTEACAGGCPEKPCHEPGVCVAGRCEYTPLPEAASCDDNDPCTTASACNATGECEATQFKLCEPAEGSCQATGTCDPNTGECIYTPKPSGTSCSSGDPCTIGTCDDSGECVGGEVCPTSNPCEVGSCSAGECVYEPRSDGEACGDDPGGRCCGGQCVDISQDPSHCGQCFFACTDMAACVSVTEPAACNVEAPVSGRCECTATSQCEGGDDDPANDQVCREPSPGAYLCAPETPEACPGEFADLDGCPNYCFYE